MTNEQCTHPHRPARYDYISLAWLERLLGLACMAWGTIILWPGAIYGTTSTFRLLSEWGIISENLLGAILFSIGAIRLIASIRNWRNRGLRTVASLFGLFDWLFMLGAFTAANGSIGPSYYVYATLYGVVIVLAVIVYYLNFVGWVHKVDWSVWRARFAGLWRRVRRQA